MTGYLFEQRQDGCLGRGISIELESYAPDIVTEMLTLRKGILASLVF
jgi:hypothetical protein